MNDIDQLKQLLLSDQNQAIADLKSAMLTRQDLSNWMAENFAEAMTKLSPEQVARLLQEPMLEVLRKSSVNRNKERLSSALSPIILPTVKQSIAQSIKSVSSSIDLIGQNLFTLRGLRWRREAKEKGVPFAKVAMDHMIEYRVESAHLIQMKTGFMVARAAHSALEADSVDLGVLDRQVMGHIQTYLGNRVGDKADNRDKSAQDPSTTIGIEPDSKTELIPAKNTIHKVVLNQRQLWFVEDGDALLACVIRGDAPSTVQLAMSSTLASVRLKYGKELGNYQGLATDSALQLSIEHLMSLEAVKQSPKSRLSLASLVFGVLGLLLLSLLVASLYGRWQHYRLSQNLEKQPSLFITSIAQDGWWMRDFIVRGIYDPMFPPKATELIVSTNIKAEDLTLELTPYLSLNPGFSLQRAQLALATPSTVKLSISGETGQLLATGTATQAWKDRASLIAPQLPYVNGINFDGLVVSQSEVIQPLVNSLESQVVSFSKGLDLALGQGATIAEQAERIKKLQTSAAQLDMLVTVKLFGFTDERGTPETNAKLQLARAEIVKAKLVDAGVAAELVSVLATPTDLVNARLSDLAKDKPLRVQFTVQLDKR